MALASRLTLALAGLMCMPLAASAQTGVVGGNDGRGHVGNGNSAVRSRAVSTQPSSNPFQNPIGQGVPPAASAHDNLNSGQTMTGRSGTLR